MCVVDTPAQLHDLLRTALPNAAVLVAGEEWPVAVVKELVARAGVVPVIAAVELTGDRAGLLAELWDAGISEVVDLRPKPTAERLMAGLRAAHARPLKLRIEAGLSRRVSMDALTLVRAAAEVVVDGGNSAGLAARVGARERTLLDWCTRESLPAPKRLLMWLRMALGAALLEQPGRSITSAARGAGYANDHSLRRALAGELGADAGAAPRAITVGRVLERFNAELRDLREAARQKRRGRAA
ncbi:MAG TPA: helix-turn-helix domain-containing protein [Longimicrobium sp.]|nr:helix-turn-helix domain-containing protein [Longimicrobium sp.]